MPLQAPRAVNALYANPAKVLFARYKTRAQQTAK
jgi:hypothetical protein